MRLLNMISVSAPTQPLGTRQIQGVRLAGGGTRRNTDTTLGTDTLNLKNQMEITTNRQDVQRMSQRLKAEGGDLKGFLERIQQIESTIEERLQQLKDSLLAQLRSGADIGEAVERYSNKRSNIEYQYNHQLQEAMDSAMQSLTEARRNRNQATPVDPPKTNQESPGLYMNAFGFKIKLLGEGGLKAVSQGGPLGLVQHVGGQVANTVGSGIAAAGNAISSGVAAAGNAIRSGVAAVGNAAVSLVKNLFHW